MQKTRKGNRQLRGFQSGIQMLKRNFGNNKTKIRKSVIVILVKFESLWTVWLGIIEEFIQRNFKLEECRFIIFFLFFKLFNATLGRRFKNDKLTVLAMGKI